MRPLALALVALLLGCKAVSTITIPGDTPDAPPKAVVDLRASGRSCLVASRTPDGDVEVRVAQAGSDDWSGVRAPFAVLSDFLAVALKVLLPAALTGGLAAKASATVDQSDPCAGVFSLSTPGGT